MHESFAGPSHARWRLRVDGQGPPLLLVHGIGPGTTAAANFASVWPSLASRFTLHAPDLLGFGDSAPTPGGRFDIDAWVAQLVAVLDATGATRVAVLGQSIGGTLALRLAAADARVAAVATCGAAGGMQRAPDALRRFWRPPRDREAFARMLAETFHDPATLTDAQVDQRLAVLDAGARDRFERLIGDDPDAAVASTRLDPALLARVTCPVLLVHGRDDRLVPCDDNLPHLAAALPRAHVLALARCGHNPLREQPAIAMAAIGAFLSAEVANG